MSMLAIMIMVTSSRACPYYRVCQIVEYKYMLWTLFQLDLGKEQTTKTKHQNNDSQPFTTITHTLIGDS